MPKLLPPPTEPPRTSPEAEQSVLGAVMLQGAALEKAADLLLPEDFQHPGNAIVFRAMLELRDLGKAVDLPLLVGHLKEQGRLEAAGGPIYLSGLAEQVGTAANIDHYAQAVYDGATKRRLWEAAQRIMTECGKGGAQASELLDLAEAKVFALSRTYLAGRLRSLDDIVAGEISRLSSLKTRVRDGRLSGVDTGFADLNSLTYGWQPGDMIVLGGRPGHGKTALSLNFALTAAMAGSPAAFFTLEMTEGQLTQRLFSCIGAVSGDSLRSGTLTAEEWAQVEDAANRLAGLPLWIVHGNHTILDIKAAARRIKAQAGALHLVVIDYLQMVRPSRPGRSRYEEVSAISRSTKELAKELAVPALVNAQLNRKLEERRDRRPIMSDLRDSGEIEQDADMIMFVYRDELYDDNTRDAGVAEILVRKQRSGRTGKFKLNFKADLSQFSNHVEDEEVPF